MAKAHNDAQSFIKDNQSSHAKSIESGCAKLLLSLAYDEHEDFECFRNENPDDPIVSIVLKQDKRDYDDELTVDEEKLLIIPGKESNSRNYRGIYQLLVSLENTEQFVSMEKENIRQTLARIMSWEADHWSRNRFFDTEMRQEMSLVSSPLVVLEMICRVVHKRERFAQTENHDVDVMHRLESIMRELLNLDDNICTGGALRRLLMLLNHSYIPQGEVKAISIVEVVNLFIQNSVSDFIIKKLKEKNQEQFGLIKERLLGINSEILNEKDSYSNFLKGINVQELHENICHSLIRSGIDPEEFKELISYYCDFYNLYDLPLSLDDIAPHAHTLESIINFKFKNKNAPSLREHALLKLRGEVVDGEIANNFEHPIFEIAVMLISAESWEESIGKNPTILLIGEKEMFLQEAEKSLLKKLNEFYELVLENELEPLWRENVIFCMQEVMTLKLRTEELKKECFCNGAARSFVENFFVLLKNNNLEMLKEKLNSYNLKGELFLTQRDICQLLANIKKEPVVEEGVAAGRELNVLELTPFDMNNVLVQPLLERRKFTREYIELFKMVLNYIKEEQGKNHNYNLRQFIFSVSTTYEYMEDNIWVLELLDSIDEDDELMQAIFNCFSNKYLGDNINIKYLIENVSLEQTQKLCQSMTRTNLWLYLLRKNNCNLEDIFSSGTVEQRDIIFNVIIESEQRYEILQYVSSLGSVLRGLTPEQVGIFCEITSVANKFEQIIKNMEDFERNIAPLNSEQIKSFWRKIPENLSVEILKWVHSIERPKELSKILRNLTVEQIDAVFQIVLQNINWPMILTMEYGFREILMDLNKEKSEAVCKNMLSIINKDISLASKSMVNEILYYLRPEQKEIFCQDIMPNICWGQFIEKVLDFTRFSGFFENVQHQQSIFWECSHNTICWDKILGSCRDIKEVLGCLTIEQRNWLWDNSLRTIDWEQFVKTDRDAYDVFYYLTPFQRETIWKIISKNILKVESSLAGVLSLLLPEQIQETFEFMSENNFEWKLVKTRDDFEKLFKKESSTDKLELFYNRMIQENNILQIIKNCDKLGVILTHLPINLFEKFCQIIRWGDVIKSGRLLSYHLVDSTIGIYIKPDRMEIICQNILEQTKWEQIKSSNDLLHIFGAFSGFSPTNPVNRDVIFKSIMEAKLWTKIIKNIQDVKPAFEYFSPEQRDIVFNEIINNIDWWEVTKTKYYIHHTYVETICQGKDLVEALCYLRPEQVREVCLRIMNTELGWRNSLHSINQISRLFRGLPSEQLEVVCQSISDMNAWEHILIEEYDDLKSICTRSNDRPLLSIKNKEIICHYLLRTSAWRSIKELTHILEYNIFFEIKLCIPSDTKWEDKLYCENMFSDFFNFNSHCKNDVFELMVDVVPWGQFFKNEEDFKRCFLCLSIAQREAICKKISKAQWIRILNIECADDFIPRLEQHLEKLGLVSEQIAGVLMEVENISQEDVMLPEGDTNNNEEDCAEQDTRILERPKY